MLFHSAGNHKQDRQQPTEWETINLQHIQTPQRAQYQKTNNLIKK